MGAQARQLDRPILGFGENESLEYQDLKSDLVMITTSLRNSVRLGVTIGLPRPELLALEDLGEAEIGWG